MARGSLRMLPRTHSAFALRRRTRRPLDYRTRTILPSAEDAIGSPPRSPMSRIRIDSHDYDYPMRRTSSYSDRSSPRPWTA